MSMLLPSERLSSLSFWVSEFIRSPELCDRSLSLLVELALLPSPRGLFMSMPLPSGRLSSLTLRNGFSALQSSSWVELALLPSPQRVTYEHAAPLWASEFPLILGNECSVLQSLLSVELALLPSPRGSSMSIPLPSERLSFLSFWGMSSPPSRARVGRASIAPLTLRVIYEQAASFWASEFPSHSDEWVLRSPELCDRSLSVLVELAWLPSP